MNNLFFSQSRNINYLQRIRNSGKGEKFKQWYKSFVEEDPFYINDPTHVRWFPKSLRAPDNEVKAKLYQRLFDSKPEEINFKRACLAVEHLRLDHGINPESWMYSGVLLQIGSTNDPYFMTYFWRQLQKNPTVTLEANAYNAMAYAFAQTLDIEGAQYILEELKGTGEKLTANSFNSLCSFKSPSVQYMLAIFECLAKEDVQPNTDSYNLLMKAYLKEQYYAKVNDAFSNIQRNGSNPSLESFEIWIESRCNAGFPTEARQIIDHLHSEKPFKIAPKASTYNILLRYFDKIGNDTEADVLVALMKERNVHLDVESYNAWMRAKYNAGKPKEAVEIFNHYSPPRNQATFSAVIDAAVQSSDYQLAADLLALAKKRGFSYNERDAPPTYQRCLTTVYPRRCDYWEDAGDHYMTWDRAVSFDKI